MAIFVISNQVIAVNGNFFVFPNYTTGVVGCKPGGSQINTTHIEVVGPVWLLPVVIGGTDQIQKYQVRGAVNESTPPTTDAMKALELKDTDSTTTYFIAITNTDEIGSTSAWATAADAAGGSVPVMPTVTIPFPVRENTPFTFSAAGNTFRFAFPANPLGLLYSIPAPTFNGVAPAAPYAPSGITTVVQVATWANTNWGMYGTWTSSGDVLSLFSAVDPAAWVSGTAYVPGNMVTDVNINYVCILAVSGSTHPASDATHWTALGATIATVNTAGIIAALTPKAYCLDLTAFSTPASVNQLVFGSSAAISIPAFTLNDVNTQAPLRLALNSIIRDPNLSYGVATAHKLTVNTVYAIPKLYFNGTLVVAATAGVCS